MAYYDALIQKWGTLTGTTEQKLAAINALMVTLPPMKAIFSPSQIINAIDYKALKSLSGEYQRYLCLLLSGSSVDVSIGTTLRQALHDLFAGSSVTLANFTALYKPFDAPQAPWWQTPVSQSGGGLTKPVSSTDLVAAGGLV